MAIMQKISEDNDVYCCLGCKTFTSEPKKYCNNCGELVGGCNDELMPKANPSKQAKKEKRKVCSNNNTPTNFYLLHKVKCWNEPFKVSGRFYSAASENQSFSKRLHNWTKEVEDDSFLDRKIVRLSESEVQSYAVFGLNIEKIFV